MANCIDERRPICFIFIQINFFQICCILSNIKLLLSLFFLVLLPKYLIDCFINFLIIIDFNILIRVNFLKFIINLFVGRRIRLSLIQE